MKVFFKQALIPILYEAALNRPCPYGHAPLTAPKAGATVTKPTCVGSIKRIFIKKWYYKVLRQI